jgi:hypothetical protein
MLVGQRSFGVDEGQCVPGFLQAELLGIEPKSFSVRLVGDDQSDASAVETTDDGIHLGAAIDWRTP